MSSRRSYRRRYGGKEDVARLRAAIGPLAPGMHDTWIERLQGFVGPVERCTTAYDVPVDELDVNAGDLKGRTPEQLARMCFTTKKGGRRRPCCEALCHGKLRCHNPQEYVARIRFVETVAGECSRVGSDQGDYSASLLSKSRKSKTRSKSVSRNKRDVVVPEGDTPEGDTEVRVCSVHLRSLQDAHASGAAWGFAKWAAYAGATVLCYHVVVPYLVSAAMPTLSAAAARYVAPRVAAAAARYVAPRIATTAMQYATATGYTPGWLAGQVGKRVVAKAVRKATEATGLDAAIAHIPTAVGMMGVGDSPVYEVPSAKSRSRSASKRRR